MKLHPDQSSVQTISSYGDGWIAVDGERIAHSVIIGSDGQRLAWHCERFADLGAAHFQQLAELGTELVIFGSGGRIRFPQPAWLAPLMERRIGLETMDTQAACRTYNILAGEGRKVAVALLIEVQPH
ncbi:MAG: Mth938-like domain-containing protein [Burkholderiaceae bacterium]|nr:Mth938-like domain-containing protein [Rhodoferax sp.]MCB2030117.1 Mth938-like domain-containing protein [Rhodoferax sp.]MCB2040188.1 Mth938-like domain-containing protein [Rhodoferax sp.]MCP5260862.1 Mth938-like domain-containing protein [Rhodoferax sp.]